MVIHGLWIDNMQIIQPICPMDEYARSVRKWVWFIPIMPPKIAFMAAIIDRII